MIFVRTGARTRLASNKKAINSYFQINAAMDTVEVLASACAENKKARNGDSEDTIEVLDTLCAEASRRHEDAPFVASEGEETETSGATEAAENGETKKNNKRKRSSSCPSKKARLAEETKRQREEAATAAVQAKVEARQHEIDLARANHSEVLVKDCTFILTCCDSKHKALINTIGSMVKVCDNPEFKEALLKAVSATETSE